VTLTAALPRSCVPRFRRTSRSRKRERAGRSRSCLGLGVAACLLASPAHAEDLVAVYQAYWAGSPAAILHLTVHDGPDGYRHEISIRSEGLPKTLTRFRATAVASGGFGPGAAPEPVHYGARYDLRRHKNRILNVLFILVRGVRTAERGPHDTSTKPPLAENFRRNVIDPLGALAAIRHELQRFPDRPFTVPVYDGARRFDVEVRPLRREAGDPPRRQLALTLRPIAGFKGESSDDGDPQNAPRPVELMLSDDARLMPLSLSVPIYYLPLTVDLVQWCTAAKPCAW